MRRQTRGGNVEGGWEKSGRRGKRGEGLDMPGHWSLLVDEGRMPGKGAFRLRVISSSIAEWVERGTCRCEDRGDAENSFSPVQGS